MSFDKKKRQNMKRTLNCTLEFTTHFTFQVTYTREFALEVEQTTQCGKSKNSLTHCTWHIELIKLCCATNFLAPTKPQVLLSKVRKKEGSFQGKDCENFSIRQFPVFLIEFDKNFMCKLI